MFVESILETSWAQHTRRGWTTLTSFGVQVVIIGALLAIPLLQTVGIPLARNVSTPITMSRRPDPGPATPTRPFHSNAVELAPIPGRLMMPSRIPTRIAPDDGPIRSEGADGPTSIDYGPPYKPGAYLPTPTKGAEPVMPVRAAASKPTFRTSTMLQGSLIRRVEPIYPPLARTARIQGSVVLEAIIGRDGAMQHLQVLSGHPMLAPAAVEAVRQWRYRPYILNEEAIEVETQITVNFILN